ncbi:hypothetical protein O6H91_23G023100 [Diphasiastrum complanatum]|uniref:Uncharacterized protein n=1 Tax=Diphasiastrum complanatum TaxID=34168 RepID=A0ACC2AAZ9_DIPCM|nr:hypothetical protein O6H91_23G023100 [Diphasiastrum complanatum]
MAVEVAGRLRSGQFVCIQKASARLHRHVNIQILNAKSERILSSSAKSSLRNCNYFSEGNVILRHHSVEHSRRKAVVVTAKTMAEKTPLRLERKYVLTEDQLSKAKAAMDAFLNSVHANLEKREGTSPYYLLHEAGDAVYGNVLLFHGFSMTPEQCRRLAQYLFENGFNVYQCSLAGHSFANPNQNWPQVHLKLQWKYKIRQKVFSDPALVEAMRSFDITQDKFEFIHKKILSLSSDQAAIIAAIIHEDEKSEPFLRFYDSSHMQFLYEAEARLQEIESLPGPAFTVGLSVGGAVALGLAAAHPEKIAKVAAYSPFLKGFNELGRKVTLIAGPLDVKEIRWVPNLTFSASCLVAADLHGHHVRQEHNIKVLSRMPTFVMLTELDDSADFLTDQQFIASVRLSSGQHGPPHLDGFYSRSEKVPHAMIDPTEESQGMTNKYWATLYQETFRFLTESIVNENQLHSLEQDPKLPQVAPLLK